MKNTVETTNTEETNEVIYKVDYPLFLRKSIITPDGKYIISSGFGSNVFMWDIENRKNICIFKTDSMISTSAISPNGKYLAVSTLARQTVLFDVHTGNEIDTFERNEKDDYSNVIFIDISDNNIALMRGKSTVEVHDLHTGKLLRTFTMYGQKVKSITFSPDGEHIVLISEDGMVMLWDIYEDKAVDTFKKNNSISASVSFSSDSKYVALETENKVVELWSIEQGRVARTLQQFSSFTFSSDGKNIFIATFQNTIKIYSIKEANLLQTFEGLSTPAKSLYTTVDGKYLLSTENNETITLWDIPSRQILRTFEGENEEDLSLGTTADGKSYFTSLIYWSKISVWDFSQSEMMYSILYRAADKNDLTGLTNSIDTPEWMKTLWVWADKYHIMPECLPRDEKSLLDLTEFYLADDVELRIEEIPEELSMLSNLTHLGLEVFGDDAIVVPESLGDLINLRELHLGLHGQKNEIPQSLSKLTQVETLSLNGDISQNDVDMLLKSYKNLQELTITSNELIGSLPDNICDGVELGKLMLRYNNNLLLSDHQFKCGTALRDDGGDREVEYCTSAGCFTLQFGDYFEYYCFNPLGE